jgi:hypothetical protein
MEINFLKAFEFFEKMFWPHKRLNYNTLCALIKVINISFEWKKKKNIRKNVHVKTRITMDLPRLGSENSFQMCGEVYDIV